MTEKTPRPKLVKSETHKILTGCEALYITIGLVNGKPIEVFITMGKSGGCSACQNAALGISLSVGLQHGVPLEVYIENLRGVRCPKPLISKDHFLSCPDAVSKILSQYVKDNTD